MIGVMYILYIYLDMGGYILVMQMFVNWAEILGSLTVILSIIGVLFSYSSKYFECQKFGIPIKLIYKPLQEHIGSFIEIAGVSIFLLILPFFTVLISLAENVDILIFFAIVFCLGIGWYFALKGWNFAIKYKKILLPIAATIITLTSISFIKEINRWYVNDSQVDTPSLYMYFITFHSVFALFGIVILKIIPNLQGRYTSEKMYSNLLGLVTSNENSYLILSKHDSDRWILIRCDKIRDTHNKIIYFYESEFIVISE